MYFFTHCDMIYPYLNQDERMKMNFSKDTTEEQAIELVFNKIPKLLEKNRRHVIKFPKRFNTVFITNKLTEMFDKAEVNICSMGYTTNKCIEFFVFEKDDEF